MIYLIIKNLKLLLSAYLILINKILFNLINYYPGKFNLTYKYLILIFF